MKFSPSEVMLMMFTSFLSDIIIKTGETCAEGQANKIDMMMAGPNREGLNQQQINNRQYNQYNQVGNNFFP